MLILATILTRLLQALRLLDSVPLLAVIIICGLTGLLTPPRTNTDWENSLRQRFVNLMSKTRRQEATDPKDKVCALYGLLRRLEIKLPNPDYTVNNSLEQTYSAFTRSIIQWHRSLEILREASGPWGANGPSWVPDWSKPYMQLRLPDNRAQYLSHTDTPPYKISRNSRELTVSVKRVGLLTFPVGIIQGFKVSFDMSEHDIFDGQIPHQVENISILREWLNTANTVFPFGNAFTVFLASIPTLQETHTSDEIAEWTRILLNGPLTMPGSDIQYFMGVPLTLGYRRRITQEIRSLAKPSTGLEYQIFWRLAADDRLWLLHQAICSISAEQATFFLIQVEGSYLFGAAPKKCHDGDIVALFPTIRLPMVVRVVDSVRKIFHLMGAAHIPQLSWNTLWPKDKANRETIILV